MRGFEKVLAAADPMGGFDIAACNLGHSERQNLSKLRYWDIIDKVRDERHRGGCWRITLEGLAFAEGMIEMQKTVTTYRNVVVKFSGPKVRIMDVAGGWKYCPDYARDARPWLDEPEPRDLFS